MTSPKFASCLTCVFLWKIASPSLHYHQQSGFISADVGDNVTLQCFCNKCISVMFYWYKLTLGGKPQLVSAFYKHDEVGVFSDEFKNSRFSLETSNGKNHLTISGLVTSDSATYYCISSHAYEFEFPEGITVSVKGSGLDIKVSETIQPEGSKTLTCTIQTGTCSGKPSVYWFRGSDDSHPGLIYSHGGRTGQCEEKAATQTHSCVYHLPMKNRNLSKAGSFFCAVASCGHILFGNEIKLDSADEPNSSDFLVYLLSGALTLSTIMMMLMAFSVYKMKKRLGYQRAESHPPCPDPTAAGPKDDENEDNLHYAALRKPRFSRSRRQREDASSHCVYSGVKL